MARVGSNVKTTTEGQRSTTASVDQLLHQLESVGDEKVRQRNAANGAGENHFGVKLGDLRVIAKNVKPDAELIKGLWSTGNVDAMLLSTLLMRPEKISSDDLEQMVVAASYLQLADWLGNYVVKLHKDKESLRIKWLNSKNVMTRRAAWMLTAERVSKSPEGLNLEGLLDQIETKMGQEDPKVQWTMNNCLAGIGIRFAEHRQRAIAIGEKLGVLRDYPTPKGCTSPFAPIWIAAIVNRQMNTPQRD